MAYLLKAIIMEPEEQLLIGNGCVKLGNFEKCITL
jgi:hypothetical protein